MAVPNLGPIGPALQIQMALQRRLRALDTTTPAGQMYPGASMAPPGRFPPLTPLPPIGGMRMPKRRPQLPGAIPGYYPMERY